MTPDIATLYTEVMDALGGARNQAEHSPVETMEALGTKIARFTTVVNALPLTERVGYTPQMTALFEALQQLESALIERREVLRQMMESERVHRVANTAYAKISQIGVLKEGD